MPIHRQPLLRPPEACWHYGINDHFKNECPAICCHYCKQKGHHIAECLAIPDRRPEQRAQVQSSIDCKGTITQSNDGNLCPTIWSLLKKKITRDRQFNKRRPNHWSTLQCLIKLQKKRKTIKNLEYTGDMEIRHAKKNDSEPTRHFGQVH